MLSGLRNADVLVVEECAGFLSIPSLITDSFSVSLLLRTFKSSHFDRQDTINTRLIGNGLEGRRGFGKKTILYYSCDVLHLFKLPRP